MRKANTKFLMKRSSFNFLYKSNGMTASIMRSMCHANVNSKAAQLAANKLLGGMLTRVGVNHAE